MASNVHSKQVATPQIIINKTPNKITQEVEGPPNAKEWIQLWESSDTLQEFCRVTGSNPASASARASYYRKRLKAMGVVDEMGRPVTLKSLGNSTRGRIDYGEIAQGLLESREKKR